MLERLIRKLIAILKEQDLDEIEVRRFWTTVRVARRRTQASSAGAAPAETAGAAHPAAGSAEPASEQVPESGIREAAAGEAGAAVFDLKEITSPMVGTFYRSPHPESEPFVQEGERVEVGNVLCIIEAMKLMNEIESDTSGVIRKILVDDAKPVEYGQPLFLVESA